MLINIRLSKKVRKIFHRDGSFTDADYVVQMGPNQYRSVVEENLEQIDLQWDDKFVAANIKSGLYTEKFEFSNILDGVL